MCSCICSLNVNSNINRCCDGIVVMVVVAAATIAAVWKCQQKVYERETVMSLAHGLFTSRSFSLTCGEAQKNILSQMCPSLLPSSFLAWFVWLPLTPLHSYLKPCPSATQVCLSVNVSTSWQHNNILLCPHSGRPVLIFFFCCKLVLLLNGWF